jgi:hypothetical protein
MAAMQSILSVTKRIAMGLIGALTLVLLAPPAGAHHSYAMYDGSTYKVFTGVIVRIVPNAAHFEMHFVPLNEARDALVATRTVSNWCGSCKWKAQPRRSATALHARAFRKEL